jgi:hypothetical protein
MAFLTIILLSGMLLNIMLFSIVALINGIIHNDIKHYSTPSKILFQSGCYLYPYKKINHL